MSRPNPIFRFIYRQLIEIPAIGRSYNDLISRLEFSGQVLGERLLGQADTPANRERLSHIIGIERWGQSRLRTLQGEPLLTDEYDSYLPEDSYSLPVLVDLFLRTRSESVGIASKLQNSGIKISQRAFHNGAGMLSVGGWLTYFIQHANVEGRRIK